MNKIKEKIWSFVYLSFLLLGCGIVIGLIIDPIILIQGGLKIILIISLVGGLVFTLLMNASK